MQKRGIFLILHFSRFANGGGAIALVPSPLATLLPVDKDLTQQFDLDLGIELKILDTNACELLIEYYHIIAGFCNKQERKEFFEQNLRASKLKPTQLNCSIKCKGGRSIIDSL